MIIKNWMNRDPVSINSDMLAKDAMDLIDEHRMRFLPVVDEGQLRGILIRSDLREAASFVTASQNIHEVNFFNTRLKVKDLMVRNPLTLSINDSFESVLKKGASLRRRFFPVVDGQDVVGTISDVDIFNSLYQLLNVDENYYGITIEDDRLVENPVKNIVEDIDELGGQVHCIFTIKQTQFKRIIVRLSTSNFELVQEALEEKGYSIIEVKVGGMISPLDVEGILLKNPAVGDCAVIEAPYEKETSSLFTYVVLNKSYAQSSELEKELKESVRSRIVDYEYTLEIKFVNSLPKTATGKVQKYKLQTESGSGT